MASESGIGTAGLLVRIIRFVVCGSHITSYSLHMKGDNISQIFQNPEAPNYWSPACLLGDKFSEKDYLTTEERKGVWSHPPPTLETFLF